MLALAASVGTRNVFHVGLVLTAFGFGFRHGIDWDHIAALTDITSSQAEPRRSMWFATLYALGHALVVFLLGFAAIVLAQRLPAEVDGVMERFVGATLIILAVYVFYALMHHGRDFRMRSRWMLVFSGVRAGVRWIHARAQPGATDDVSLERELVPAGGGSGSRAPAGHHHHHLHGRPGAHMPLDPFTSYAPGTAFTVGMVHGIGAETPTQVLIFLAAAGAGGRGVGMLLLFCFLVGLLTSNSVIALAGTFGFLGAAHNFKLYVAVSVVTAAFSLVVGAIFLFGSSAVLPAMLGG